MYVLVDWFFTLLTLTLTVLLPIYLDGGAYFLIGIAAYLLYPLLIEPIYDICAICIFSHSKEIKR